MQSGRLGVISSSSTCPAIAKTAASGVPGSGAAPSRSEPASSDRSSTRMPSDSASKPSSAAERIIPVDCTPRSRALRSLVPSGSTAPGSATATSCPSATLGAPQTICARPSSPCSTPPRSTRQTERRSASGWRSTERTRPTRKRSGSRTPSVWMASTLVPVIVSSWAISSSSSRGLQYSRSHSIGTLISAHRSTQLPQEAHVVLEVQAQVGDPVAEHRDALDPHPPREALHALRVVPGRICRGVRHRRKDVWIDLAGAQHLQPALSLAERAATTIGVIAAPRAGKAGDIHLHRGLGEGEEVRPQPHLALAPEDGARKCKQRALEVSKGDPLAHSKPLQLVELGRVGSVGVRAVDTTRNDDKERRRMGFHGPDLHR